MRGMDTKGANHRSRLDTSLIWCEVQATKHIHIHIKKLEPPLVEGVGCDEKNQTQDQGQC